LSQQHSTNQKIQEDQYHFPYHYIPQYQKEKFQQNFNFSWGYEYLSYLQFIIDKVKEISPNSLLDVGCGDGRFLHEVNKQLNISSLLGVDYSQKAIELAKVLNPNILFIAGDIKNRELTKNYFDCITLIETLEHIPPQESKDFLIGVKNFLKPDGRLILTVPCDNVPVTPKHYLHFNESSLKNAIKDSFDIEKIFYLNRINSFRFNILKRLLTNPLFICNFQPIKNYTYQHYLKHCLQANQQNAGRIFAICTPKKQ